MRVEGSVDLLDIELFDATGQLVVGKQVKVRRAPYTWARGDLVPLIRRWVAADTAPGAHFEFVTDGILGPSAEEVRDAVSDAADGHFSKLENLLGEGATPEELVKASRIRVRQDVGGIGALLSRADQQARGLLPSARSDADADQRATSAIDAIIRLLLRHASADNPVDRIVSRSDLCAVLGISPEALRIVPWASEMRDRYLTSVRGLEPFAGLKVGLLQDNFPDSTAATVDDLLTRHKGPAVVSGPTGSGKSTAAAELRAEGAKCGRPVIIVHAEAFIPGRIDSLIADAVAAMVGSQVSSTTGRQVLSDSLALIVIDGTSEIPIGLRQALAEELRVTVASELGAGIVLLGRDLTPTRTVLPTNPAPRVFRIKPFDHERRRALALSIIDDRMEDRTAWALLAQAEAALGDAADSPMLLTMALNLLKSGTPLHDRAAVYSAVIAQLGRKSGVEGLGIASVVLGACFARLLDEGRRYADPYTWRRLLVDESLKQSRAIGLVDANQIEEAGRRSGLIANIGHTEIIGPLHDSFADYLAGLALARGAVVAPAEIQPGDRERLLFAAQIGGVQGAIASIVASGDAFALPQLARLDCRTLGPEATAEISGLLRRVVHPDGPTGAHLWRGGDGRIVAFPCEGEGHWFTDEEARVALTSRAWLTDLAGPVDVAARVWRQWILARLNREPGIGRSHPRTIDEARRCVIEQTDAAARETQLLADALFPAVTRGAVLEEIGPLGLTGQVRARANGPRASNADWAIDYTPTHELKVTIDGEDPPHLDHMVRSTLDSIVGLSAPALAAERVRHAINAMAGMDWL